MTIVKISYAGGEFEVDEAEIELAKVSLREGKSVDNVADDLFRNNYGAREAMAIVEEARKRLNSEQATA